MIVTKEDALQMIFMVIPYEKNKFVNNFMEITPKRESQFPQFHTVL